MVMRCNLTVIIWYSYPHLMRTLFWLNPDSRWPSHWTRDSMLVSALDRSTFYQRMPLIIPTPIQRALDL